MTSILPACGVPAAAGMDEEGLHESQGALTPDGRVLTDLYLVASFSSYPAPPPTGYDLVGFWDVDKGGSLGTNNTTGTYMMAMYARYEFPESVTQCVVGVKTMSSDQSSLPPTQPDNFTRKGYWDVDKGGAVGANGYWGTYMMGLYTANGPVSDGRCVRRVTLVASNASTPQCVYTCAGWWDVDAGGSQGTDLSFGTWVMTLSTLSQ